MGSVQNLFIDFVQPEFVAASPVHRERPRPEPDYTDSVCCVAGKAFDGVADAGLFAVISGRSPPHRRVKQLFAETPASTRSLNLAKPVGRLSVENLTYFVPGNPKPLLRGVSFELEAGEIGQVCFRGPQNFMGYVNDPVATATAWARKVSLLAVCSQV